MNYKVNLQYLIATILLSTLGFSYASPIFVNVGKNTTTQNGKAFNINEHSYKVDSKGSVRIKIPLRKGCKGYKYRVLLELSTNKDVKRGLDFYNISSGGNGIYKAFPIMASNEYVSGNFKKIQVTQEIISDKNAKRHDYYNLDISNNHNKTHFRVKLVNITVTKL